MVCVGGIFLAICGSNLVASSAFANDIPQELCDFNGCRPMEDIAMEAAIGSGIFGGIITAAGLFFFVYGMKQRDPNNVKS
jgi:hypothetical protein